VKVAENRPVAAYALALCAAGASLVLGLYWSSRGFDFTDEGYYLVWISNPWLYRASVSQFGYVYHPVYALLSGDVALLRQTGMLVTYGLAVLCMWCLLRAIDVPRVGSWSKGLVLFGTPVAALSAYSTWLPTPNYNLLAFQGMLLAMAGLLLVTSPKGEGWTRFLGALLLGSGGWLTFMAKPTSAIGLAALALLFACVAGARAWRPLLWSCLFAVVLLVAGAYAIDGGVLTYFRRLSGGAALASSLGGGHSAHELVRFDGLKLGRSGGGVLLLGVLTLLVMWRSSRRLFDKPLLICVATALVGFPTVMFSAAMLPTIEVLQRLEGKLMLSVPLAAIVVSALSPHAHDTGSARYRRWLVVVLLALPYAYAVGSNRNYWSVGASAGYFWVLAGLVLVLSRVPDSRQPLLLSFVLGVLLITSIQLNTAYQRPYRQPESLWAQRHETMLTEQPSALLTMPESYGLYIENARKRAASAGFRHGQFVLDMTGQSPGLLYALGARSVGQAWFIGGYRGSTRRAAALLALVPCQDLIQSWILFEHQGARRLSPTLTSAFGAAFPDDYRAVAQWQTPSGAGGSAVVRDQTLYKPARDERVALQACEKARLTHAEKMVQEPPLTRFMK